uniref:SCO-spondin n=1 Tax=Latimeria chalumnae TaxID=7897 RepID=H3AZK0_LATCH
VPGGWCEWSEWTPCSKTCGYEMISRYRTCSCPKPQNGGESCVGIGTFKEMCVCVWVLVDGGWSSWGLWSPCSGCSGASVRMRECTNPPARFGGLPCEVHIYDSPLYCGGGQVHFECGKPCPRSCDDLHISTVCLDSSECQPSCGCLTGQVLQDGVCIEPAECRCKYQNSTLEPGETVQAPCLNCTCETGHLNCTSDPLCRLNGGWSSWSQWTPCSQSCRGGTRYRFRDCNNPAPQNGGKGCLGISQQQRECNLQGCDVDGGWSRWSPWSRCDRTCGGGKSVRTRSCSSPPPKNGGKNCRGKKYQVKLCNPKPCGNESCPPSMEYVNCANRCPRHCTDYQRGIACIDSDPCEPGCRCPEGKTLSQQDGGCVLPWQCECTDAQGLNWAPGSSRQDDCNNCTCSDGQIICTNDTCPTVDGTWTPWSPWSDCPVTCGQGTQIRNRACINPPPRNNGSDCEGPETEAQNCSTLPCPGICPVDGGWCEWSDWTPCSQSCGPGIVTRRRNCSCQGPNHGGKPCEGPESESRICDLRECEKANCDIPFEYRDCGSPCGALCSSFQQKEECENSTLCVPGCYCPEGLLEFNGTCVPLSE